jgi:hypothetical protein
VTDEYDEACFDDEFFEYARRALELAGIETDAKLKVERPIRHSLLHCISDNIQRYRIAREQVPHEGAIWELERFMQCIVGAAIWDLQWGAIKNFPQFEFLYRRILGEDSRPYLPMVFGAAAWSPNIEREFAATLLASMPHRLCHDLFGQ